MAVSYLTAPAPASLSNARKRGLPRPRLRDAKSTNWLLSYFLVIFHLCCFSVAVSLPPLPKKKKELVLRTITVSFIHAFQINTKYKRANPETPLWSVAKNEIVRGTCDPRSHYTARTCRYYEHVSLDIGIFLLTSPAIRTATVCKICGSFVTRRPIK